MKNEEFERLWEDPAHWGGGLSGWYFCKDDPRLWVPKKIRSMGWTVNLGHPQGGRTLVGLFLLPSVILVLVLLSVVFSASVNCG